MASSYSSSYSQSGLPGISAIAEQLMQAQYAWGQQQFAQNSQLTDQVVGDMMNLYGSLSGMGTTLMNQYSQYFMPTALDMPETVALIAEAPEETGPFGAKGVGEPALIPTAPAILNAIHTAAGVRVKELPATPERIWTILNSPSEG